jgi:hypothetical protein
MTRTVRTLSIKFKVSADVAAEISAIAAADMVFDFLAILALGVDTESGKLAGRTLDEL